MAVPLLRRPIQTTLRIGVRSRDQDVRATTTRRPSVPSSDAVRADSACLPQREPTSDDAELCTSASHPPCSSTPNTDTLRLRETRQCACGLLCFTTGKQVGCL